MKHATLCYLLKEKEILLGFKKTGLGEGLLNGYGGKVEEGESVEVAAVREVYEEAGVIIDRKHLEKAATIDFIWIKSSEWNQTVHVFVTKLWQGEPLETEEMRPVWQAIETIPYDKMWEDDLYWLPSVIVGKKIRAEFTFGEDNKTIIYKNMWETKQL